MDSTLKAALLAGATRQIKIRFPDNDHAEITSGIVSGSLSLECTLNSDRELNFGECNAGQFVVEVENIDNITGKNIQVYEIVEDYEDEVKLFTGRVYSAESRPEHNTRVITAYDALYFRGEEDVTEWYNVIFAGVAGVTMKDFRDSLFAYMGITQATQTLLNDSLVLHLYGTDSKMTFGEIIRLICQLNACYGHIEPDGTFKYIYLGTETVDYSGNYLAHASKYSEFDVQRIDNVRLFDMAGYVAAQATNGSNAWNIIGNYLLAGQLATELAQLASTLCTYASTVTMRNVDLEALLSLPVEIGSRLTYTTHTGETIESYVLYTRFYGSQLVDQVITASVDEHRQTTLSKEEEQALTNIRINTALAYTLDTTYTTSNTQYVFTAHLYYGSDEVTQRFDPMKFKWMTRNEDGDEFLGYGYSITLNRTAAGYVGTIVCQWTDDPEEANIISAANDQLVSSSGDTIIGIF